MMLLIFWSVDVGTLCLFLSLMEFKMYVNVFLDTFFHTYNYIIIKLFL